MADMSDSSQCDVDVQVSVCGEADHPIHHNSSF
eukprot:COSAG05_NODE_13776_length_418_cov_1.025078_1_plen_32_part_10